VTDPHERLEGRELPTDEASEAADLSGLEGRDLSEFTPDEASLKESEELAKSVTTRELDARQVEIATETIQATRFADRWVDATIAERTELLQDVETRLAEATGRKPLGLRLDHELTAGVAGQTSSEEITVNPDLDGEEAMRTIVHESRHAYQRWAVENPDTTLDPRAEVWAENLAPGAYVDPVDTPAVIEPDGRLVTYEMQPVEADAFAFEERVVRGE
jgi:hypothetical protein